MTAILVLGAAVWPQGPSPTLLRRSLHAATLWHKGAAPLIIACGGLGKHPPSEAAAIRDILVDAGVPEQAILLEDHSTTTFENIRNALLLLPGREVIIVTDSYHGRRANMVAHHFGLRAAIDCPFADGWHVKQHLREFFARGAYAAKLRRLNRI